MGCRAANPTIRCAKVALLCAQVLGKPRHHDTAFSRFYKGDTEFTAGARTGAPKKTTEAERARFVAKLEELKRRKQGEVVARVIKNRVRTRKTIHPQTVSRVLRAAGYHWKRVTRRLDLSDLDKLKSQQFAQQWKDSPLSMWKQKCIFMDNSAWTPYLTYKGRRHAAQSQVRGGYCKVKQKIFKTSAKKHRYGSGQKNISCCVGIGDGRVHFVEFLERNWCAAEYVRIFKKSVAPAVRSLGHQGQLVHDNDRTGYTSNAGKEAERASGIGVLSIPVRRPDLMVLDYSLHHRVNEILREEEETWPRSRTETRQAYQERVRKAFFTLSEDEIRKACGGMKKRLEWLAANDGGHIPRDF